MLALQIQAFGVPDGLQLVDLPRPQPHDDEVLVEVRAAGLNPSDLANVYGRFPQTTLPRIPGRDFAGVIVEGPAELIGTEIWGTGEFGFTRDGTHAQLLVVPRAAVCVKPATLSMEHAAAVGVPFLTAWLMLQAARVESHASVLIIGARGAVGNAAAQLARLRGLRVFGVQREGPQGDECYEVISSSTQEVAATVRSLTDGHGVDACLDTVSGALFAAGLASLAHGGRFVAITARDDGIVHVNLRDFYHRELHLIGVDSLQVDALQTTRLSEALGAYHRLGQALRTGASSMKTVLIPDTLL